MGKHLWRRPTIGYITSEETDKEENYEYAETDGLTAPPGEGWRLASAFGVGSVMGGASPARSSYVQKPRGS